MRIFRCDACGHRMRLGGDMCGKCFEPKPIWKSPWLHAIAAVLGSVLIGAAILAALAHRV